MGLHYNRFRYYDPKLARYIQSDPWGISGGFNLYAYRSNPLCDVDVRGLGSDPPKDDEPGAGGTDKEGAKGAKSGNEPHDHGQEPSAFPDLDRGGGNSDTHADRVVDAIKNADPPMAKNRSVTVIEHENGTVLVGLSKGTDEQRTADAQKVVNALNEQYPPKEGQPNTYRTAEINDGVKQGQPRNDAYTGEKPAPPFTWNCSEAQAAQAAGTHPESPPKNYQTVWTGPGENQYPYTGPGGPTTPGGNEKMAPRNTCLSNTDNYKNMSNPPSNPPAGDKE